MPRRLRRDYPESWHHVLNRGIAKRTLFESPRDVRYFLACLARQSRAGRIEIHAYAILTTHFHLLVRSPVARLSEAMQQSQDAYARWFNRSRRRDGPLFRGRFTNRIIENDDYWGNVLRYIDHNPVSAGLAVTPSDFPFGSAFHYSRSRAGPPWLHRSEVEAWVGGAPGAPLEPAAYRRFCTTPIPPGKRWVIERRLATGQADSGSGLEALLSGGSPSDRSWLEFKAALADGVSLGIPVLSPDSVGEAVHLLSVEDPQRVLARGRSRSPWWETLLAGTLRSASGLPLDEIAERTTLSFATARRRVHYFRSALEADGRFAEDAASVVQKAWELDGMPVEEPREGTITTSRPG